ncbi:MAG: hypothetical protein WCO91_10690, partial [Gemmataceae bacterium]
MIPIEKLRFCWSSRILAFVFPIVLLLIAGGYFGLKSSNQGKGDPSPSSAVWGQFRGKLVIF